MGSRDGQLQLYRSRREIHGEPPQPRFNQLSAPYHPPTGSTPPTPPRAPPQLDAAQVLEAQLQEQGPAHLCNTALYLLNNNVNRNSTAMVNGKNSSQREQQPATTETCHHRDWSRTSLDRQHFENRKMLSQSWTRNRRSPASRQQIAPPAA